MPIIGSSKVILPLKILKSDDIPDLNESSLEMMIQNNIFAIIYFYSHSCSSSIKIESIIKDIIQEIKNFNDANPLNIEFGKVNYDKNEKLVEKYHIQEYPSILIFNKKQFFKVNINKIRESIQEVTKIKIWNFERKNGKFPFLSLYFSKYLKKKAMKILELTDESFQDDIKNMKNLIIIFYANWCTRSQKIIQFFGASESREKKDLYFGKLNIEKNIKIVKELKISEIPTILYYKNGKRMKEIIPKIKFIKLFLKLENHQ